MRNPTVEIKRQELKGEGDPFNADRYYFTSRAGSASVVNFRPDEEEGNKWISYNLFPVEEATAKGHKDTVGFVIEIGDMNVFITSWQAKQIADAIRREYR